MDTEDYNYYKNTGPRNTRNRKQILILDVNDGTSLGSGGEFNIPLLEPLIIDKQSEVYLDNFISYNGNITNTPGNSAFCLKINEFNISSNVASSLNSNTIYNSIIIPNEGNSATQNHSSIIHKAKKFNYVCDVNPGKIGSISGKILNLEGAPIFHGPQHADKYTYALTGLNIGMYARGANHKWPLENDTKFVITGISAADVTVHALAHTQSDATTFHFSSVTNIDLPSFADSIIFTFKANPQNILTITNGSGDNPDLYLLNTDARFIAEFTISSRE